MKPYHGRPYPIPHKHKAILMKEIKWLCDIGELESRLCIPAGIQGIRRNPQKPGLKKKELRSFFAGTSRKSRTDHKRMLKNTFLFCWYPFLLTKCLFTRELINPSFQLSGCNFGPIICFFRCCHHRLLYRCCCTPPPHHQHCPHHHHREAHPWHVILVAVVNALSSALVLVFLLLLSLSPFPLLLLFLLPLPTPLPTFLPGPF
jgi:hypothetical protein